MEAGGAAKARERIGLVVVHGVGAQGQCEHLMVQARNLYRAIRRHVGATGRVSLEFNEGQGTALGATKASLQLADIAPVSIVIKHSDGREQEILFHEVWWADQDQVDGPAQQIQFIFWALSTWATAGLERDCMTVPDGFKRLMRLPNRGNILKQAWKFCSFRFKLFWLAMMVPTIVLSISVYNFVMRRLSLDNATIKIHTLLFEYMGDVRVYRHPAPRFAQTTEDVGELPRVSIRKRMIRTLFDVACQGYDRWYVLGHSLGSVVALNALMETEDCLPNFLDRRRWQRFQKSGAYDRAAAPIPPGDIASMRPARPAWLADGDRLPRRWLFDRFAGFLSYGSPLERFARIWPHIVPLNQDERVFQPGAFWVNVFSPTDFVSTRIGALYQPLQRSATALAPKDVTYLSSMLPFTSHTNYFAYSALSRDNLVDRVARCVVDNKAEFGRMRFRIAAWIVNKLSRMLGLAVVLLLALVLSAVSGAMLYELFQHIDSAKLDDYVAYMREMFGLQSTGAATPVKAPDPWRQLKGDMQDFLEASMSEKVGMALLLSILNFLVFFTVVLCCGLLRGGVFTALWFGRLGLAGLRKLTPPPTPA